MNFDIPKKPKIRLKPKPQDRPDSDSAIASCDG